MVLSMKWLSDFVDCNDIDIKKYCDRMTDTGSKVEGFELCGSEVDGVRVGHILKVEQHPDAERLRKQGRKGDRLRYVRKRENNASPYCRRP